MNDYNHYFKDVSNLNHIDVYRILKLYDVTDPCIQHAIKKLLCAGQRGVKSTKKDYLEAVDAIQRALEMMYEDGEQ